MEIKGIKYISPMFDNSGYAQASRGYIMALNKLGIPLTLSPISFERARPDLGEDGKFMYDLVNKDIDYNVVIVHTTPEFWSKYKESGKTNIGYTIWETTKLHPDWPDYINQMDKVLVGTDWNVGVFIDSGVTIPIGVVPHGIEVSEFDGVKPYELASVNKDTFVFYDIFQWCYDDKTRVLTKDGFKYFKDLEYNDEVATLNKKTEELEYYKPDKIVKFKRKDTMMKLTGTQFDICVTPDHKMVVKEHIKGGYGSDPEKDWELKPLNEMIIKNKHGELKVSGKYRAKKSCKWTFGEEKDFFDIPEAKGYKYPLRKDIPTRIKMDDFLEFLGWYLSEGSIEISKKYYRTNITQTKSAENIEEITKCIERMGFKPIIHGGDILFNSRDICLYLSVFGKCNEKYIPKWVKNLSSRQIKILLTSMMKGDGSYHSNKTWCKYVTTSKKLAEDVQECLLKIGYSGAISTSDPSEKIPGEIDGRLIRGKLLQYTVSINRERNEPSMYYADLEEVPYDGYIYCATVPNHAMLVERNGKVIFSGNTERKHPLALIKGYWYAFQNDENVALVLKTYRGDYSEVERNAIRGTLQKIREVTPLKKFPPIYYIPEMLSRKEILGLHARGDCYVSFDRGEGFGLCPFEAGASGNPIIVTGFGGVTQYAKKTNSYLVNYVRVPVFGMPWCMSLNSLVKTPYGYVLAKDLQEGDAVINKNLKEKNIAKLEIRSLVDNEEVYSLKCFSIPEHIEVTADHKLYVIESNSINPTVKKVSDINVGDYIYVPKPKIVSTTYQDDKKSYLSGLYLAEGWINNLSTAVSFGFNLNEKDTLGKVCKDYMKVVFRDNITHLYERDRPDYNSYEVTFYSKDAVNFFLSNFGNGSHTKFIADDFKYDMCNLELLKGYWDGDGHIRKEGYKNKKAGKRRISPECVASTTSFDLAMDLRDLLLSLEIVPSINKNIRKDGRISYVISVSNTIFDKIFDIQNATRIGSKYSIDISNVGFGVLITKKELLENYDDLICSISVDLDDEDEEDGGSYLLNGVASSNSPWYRGDQLWAEPDIEGGALHMRHVYENKREAKKIGQQLKRDIARNFSWEIVGQKMIDEIEGI